MEQNEIEHLLIALNSTLEKFWNTFGVRDKDVKTELIERVFLANTHTQ